MAAGKSGSSSKTVQSRAMHETNNDGLIHEWPEAGLTLFHSPYDLDPQIKIEDGRITEMGGVCEQDFDRMDQLIVRYAINIQMVP